MRPRPHGIVYWTCVLLAGWLVGIAAGLNWLAGRVNQSARRLLQIAGDIA